MSNRPVAIGLYLYRVLAHAFRYDFREAFGQELLQVADETIEPIWPTHGVLGLLILLADITFRVIGERLAEL